MTRTTPSPPHALHLQGIWKIFGEDADSFLQKFGTSPADSDLQKVGLIAAVRDANLDIHRGEIFVIMGLSGSGKSTLVRCMSRLIEPTAGEL
ncbi:MAG: ATP-binding cassette domain-containing protein, partial [Acidiferrobacteraceae bacterium]|nr:ATP-binding cassette domain-containing protein [Acidiferrobacteraceae bacterium]